MLQQNPSFSLLNI